MQYLSRSVASILLMYGVCTIILTTGARVHAAGTMADAMCVPVQTQCGCGMVMGPKGCVAGANKFMCPCFDITSGFTTPGICIANFKCQAQSSDGKPPEMPKLPEPKPSQSDQGAGSDPCIYGGAGSGSFGGSSTSSKEASSTCSQTGGFYQPGVSSSIDTSSLFSSSGSASTNTSVPDLVSSLLGGSNSSNSAGGSASTNAGGASASSAGTSGASSASGGSLQAQQPVNVSEGVLGDIRIAGNAVTILVSNRDLVSKKQIAGFSGAVVSNGATAQNVYTAMCATRPWSTNFLASIVPPSFFDGLCTLRGYRVGVPTATAAPQTTNTAPTAPAKPKPAAAPAPAVEPAKPAIIPQADVWAVPTAVARGERATIFWSSKNAESCAVASGDGRFSQTGLSGGKASGALNAATTFTISCTSSTGEHATDFVTVNITQ